jgi:hypothetical protein
MLLKADAAGPAWTDERIPEAFDSRTCTVEKLRERFVAEGFESTLDGNPRQASDRKDTQRQARGAGDRLASQPAVQGLRQRDTAADGAPGRGLRDRRVDRP